MNIDQKMNFQILGIFKTIKSRNHANYKIN
jgi:hypothetical protein